MEIKFKDSVPAPILAGTPAEAYGRFAERRQLIDEAFREMAIHYTPLIDNEVLAMLESKIGEVKAKRPDLDDATVYVVAGRLLKQLISCYQSALNQLLP